MYIGLTTSLLALHIIQRIHHLTYRIAQNFGGRKTFAELELQENWWRKLWWLAEAKSIQYLSSRDLTTFWQIKLWRIGNGPPNPPKFSPAKVLCCTVVLGGQLRILFLCCDMKNLYVACLYYRMAALKVSLI